MANVYGGTPDARQSADPAHPVSRFRPTYRALTDHELVKVKARVGEREARDLALTALTTRTTATLVQRIGNVALLFRPNTKGTSRIVIPD